MDAKHTESAKTMFAPLLLLFGLVFFAGTPAIAQSNKPAPAPETGEYPGSPAEQYDEIKNLAIADQDFVSRTIRRGTADIQFGRLAVQKSASVDVKQLGKKMVEDSTALNEQMTWAAEHMHVRVPSKVSRKDRAQIAKLRELSGLQFERAYIVATEKRERDELGEFEEEARQIRDPNLKPLILMGSGLIQLHLEMINQISEGHGLSNADRTHASAGH